MAATVAPTGFAGGAPAVAPVVVDEAAEAALIAAAGVDVSVPLRVRHVLLVHDPAAAEALASSVRGEGYDVTIDTHDGGWTWIVGAAETVTLSPAYAAAARAALTVLATRHGAEYEGWEVTTS